MSAWVTREWREDGKVRRKKMPSGLKGVRETDRFVVEWIDPSGKRCREKIEFAGRPGKRLADEKAQQVTSKLTLGSYDAHSRIRWKDFRKQYEDEVLSIKAESTQRVERESLVLFERLCKPKYIGGIRTRTIDTFKARLMKRRGQKAGSTMSPANANKHLRHLKAVLRKAHRWEYLPKLPEIVFLHEPEKMPVYMQPKHFDAIYSACEHAVVPTGRPYSSAAWWQAVMVTGIMAGLRIMEMMELLWEDVFLDEGYIVVRHVTAKGRRDDIVPLHSVAVNHLRRLTDIGLKVFDWPLRRKKLWDEWTRIQQQAGIELSCHGNHEHTARCHVYGFHALKKACGTLNAGRLPKVVLNAFMRHRAFATTERYYLVPVRKWVGAVI